MRLNTVRKPPKSATHSNYWGGAVRVFSTLAALAALNFSVPVSAQVAATVGTKKITVQDLERANDVYFKNFPYQRPGQEQVLEYLINRTLGVEEAYRLKLDKDPKVREKIADLLFQSLVERSVRSKIDPNQITNKQIRVYYDKNPELRTSHILIPVLANAPQAERKRAIEQLREIRQKHLLTGKMSFAEAAQRFSEDGLTAAMGGDLDYQSRLQLGDEYYEAALKLSKMKKINISDVVQTPRGYHLIYLTSVRKWLEADPVRVKQEMVRVQEQELFDSFMKNLRAKSKISINKKVLSSVN